MDDDPAAASNTFFYLFLMAALIVLSAYFSATETAFSSLNRTRLKTMADKGNKRAALAHQLGEQYDKLLSTILIGNNIVNIATASIGTMLFVKLYGDLGATISTVIVTIVVLIFGEISPKSIAKDCPERFAMFSAPILRALMWLLTPLNAFFSWWKKMLTYLFHLDADTRMSQEELLTLVNEVQQDGSIDQNEGALLRAAIEFTDREAEDILTHRVDLEAIPVTASKEEIAHVFSASRYSRLLVYEGTIDNIIGALHQKDFYTGCGITQQPLRSILSPVVFVMQAEKISVLLKLLQKNKSHVAVVLDEYGGTYGIVTMEDILEELVGEIWDEHDEVTTLIEETGPNRFLVDASIDLEDFCSTFELKTSSEMVSLSGWVMEQLGHIPHPGDTFRFANFEFTIKEVEYHRVASVEVQRLVS